MKKPENRNLTYTDRAGICDPSVSQTAGSIPPCQDAAFAHPSALSVHFKFIAHAPDRLNIFPGFPQFVPKFFYMRIDCPRIAEIIVIPDRKSTRLNSSHA